jgi:hypothetical protein
MGADLEPPELARVVAFAERTRVGDWSLRSALCRYAQAQPRRVREVLDLVRRIEFALPAHAKRLAREGPAIWSALGGATDDVLVELVRAMSELDELGDVLADWAEDRAGKHPEAGVDAVTQAVGHRLDALDLPREERERPPRGGGRR